MELLHDRLDVGRRDVADHDLLLRRGADPAGTETRSDVGHPSELVPCDAAGARREAHIHPAVLLREHADVVALPCDAGRRRVAVGKLEAEVLVLDDLTEPLRAPVGDQELQARAVADAPVAVITECAGDARPHVGDERRLHEHAEPLREVRIGPQPAADPQVEADLPVVASHADE